MKALLSIIRHIVTWLAGIGTYLAAHGLIDPGQTDAANQYGAQLVEPLCGILGLMAVVTSRLVMAWVGKKFPALADKIAGVDPGGLPLLLMTCTAAGLMGLALPSCSAVDGVSVGFHGPDGSVQVTAGGGEVAAEVRVEK